MLLLQKFFPGVYSTFVSGIGDAGPDFAQHSQYFVFSEFHARYSAGNLRK